MERLHLFFLRKHLAEGGFLGFLFPGLAAIEMKGSLKSGSVLSGFACLLSDIPQPVSSQL